MSRKIDRRSVAWETTYFTVKTFGNKELITRGVRLN